jgi:hypothetical protein
VNVKRKPKFILLKLKFEGALAIGLEVTGQKDVTCKGRGNLV